MARLRFAALTFTVSLIVSGCYTQLRAPYEQHHTSDSIISPQRTWHSPSPIFYLPRYDHHDWWLYGDTYCDIWIDRYTYYHPWITPFETYSITDRHSLWGHGFFRYRSPISRFWWRHHGPRFEPLSPTIEITIERVERRSRFRRDGFAGGVPIRGVDIVTMGVSGPSAGRSDDRPAETETLRVTRPRKIRKLLVPALVASRGDEPAAAEITHLNWTKEGVWVKSGARPTVPSETLALSGQDTNASSGRDLQSWGSVPDVKKRPLKRPKLETNWFIPEADSEKDVLEAREPVLSRSEGNVRTDERSPEAARSLPKSEPQAKPGQTRAAPAAISGEQPTERRRTVAVRTETRRTIGGESKPELTRSSPGVEKRRQPKPNYASPPKKVERRREEVRRSAPPKDSDKGQSKVTDRKEEKSSKKMTQKKDKEDREEKRRKSGRRRGM